MLLFVKLLYISSPDLFVFVLFRKFVPDADGLPLQVRRQSDVVGASGKSNLALIPATGDGVERGHLEPLSPSLTRDRGHCVP